MNKFFKYLSLSIAVLPFFTSMNTHCMRIKRLNVKPIAIAPRYYSSEKINDKLADFFKFPDPVKEKKRTQSIPKMSTENLIKLIRGHQALEATIKAIQETGDHDVPAKPKQSDKKAVLFGPLKNFTPTLELDRPSVEEEDWLSDETDECILDLLCVFDAHENLTSNSTAKALMCLSDTQQSQKKKLLSKIDPEDMTPKGPAWKELDIDKAGKNIPIGRPSNGKHDPATTLKQGEEIKWARAMSQLQTHDNW
jgi:hypothetical protein